MLRIERSLETAYILAGLPEDADETIVSVRNRLTADDVDSGDFALIATPEIAFLTDTHQVDPVFGIWTSESGAVAMRSPVRPDEIDVTSILLYDVSITAELLARATIWPFYGIKATNWTRDADGTSAITIVDGITALEAVEAGFSEDLVRAWYILTEQPVVTHLLAVPIEATDDQVASIRVQLSNAAAAGCTDRREVRKQLQADSSVEGERLVEFLGRIRYDLDDLARISAFSLIARGAGGTRIPLIREILWRTTD